MAQNMHSICPSLSMQVVVVVPTSIFKHHSGGIYYAALGVSESSTVSPGRSRVFFSHPLSCIIHMKGRGFSPYYDDEPSSFSLLCMLR